MRGGGCVVNASTSIYAEGSVCEPGYRFSIFCIIC